MNRRDFITWVGLGAIASSLPIAITACFANTTPPTSSASKDWQKVGTSAELDKTGQLLATNSPIGPVLVIGTSKSKSLIAVNPTCTHKGCTVDWKPQPKKFICPCHQAEYDLNGKVQKGPAKKSLSGYAVKIEGNSVFVKQNS